MAMSTTAKVDRLSTTDMHELTRRVRQEGGSHRDELHEHHDVNKGTPGYDRTSGCGRQRTFKIPYESQYGIRHAIACADCDLMARWPKFSGTRGE